MFIELWLKLLAQSHSASQWLSQERNSGVPAPIPMQLIFVCVFPQGISQINHCINTLKISESSRRWPLEWGCTECWFTTWFYRPYKSITADSEETLNAPVSIDCSSVYYISIDVYHDTQKYIGVYVLYVHIKSIHSILHYMQYSGSRCSLDV